MATNPENRRLRDIPNTKRGERLDRTEDRNREHMTAEERLRYDTLDEAATDLMRIFLLEEGNQQYKIGKGLLLPENERVFTKEYKEAYKAYQTTRERFVTHVRDGRPDVDGNPDDLNDWIGARDRFTTSSGDKFNPSQSIGRKRFGNMSPNQARRAFDELAFREWNRKYPEGVGHYAEKLAAQSEGRAYKLEELTQTIGGMNEVNLLKISQRLVQNNLTTQSLINLEDKAIRILPDRLKATILYLKASGAEGKAKAHMEALVRRIPGASDLLHFKEARSEILVSGDLPDKLMNLSGRVLDDPLNPNNLVYLLGAAAGAWMLKNSVFDKSSEDGWMAKAGKFGLSILGGFGLMLGVDHLLVKKMNPRGSGMSDALGLNTNTLGAEGTSLKYIRDRYGELGESEAAFQSLLLVSSLSCKGISEMIAEGLKMNPAGLDDRMESSARARGVDPSDISNYDGDALLGSFKVILDRVAILEPDPIDRGSYNIERNFYEAANKKFEETYGEYTLDTALYSILNNIFPEDGPLNGSTSPEAQGLRGGIYHVFDTLGMLNERDDVHRRKVAIEAVDVDKVRINGVVWNVKYEKLKVDEPGQYLLTLPGEATEPIKIKDLSDGGEFNRDKAKLGPESIVSQSNELAAELIFLNIPYVSIKKWGIPKSDFDLAKKLELGADGCYRLKVSPLASKHLRLSDQSPVTIRFEHKYNTNDIAFSVINVAGLEGKEYFGKEAGTGFDAAMTAATDGVAKKTVDRLSREVLGNTQFKIKSIEEDANKASVTVILPEGEATLHFKNGGLDSWVLPKESPTLRAQQRAYAKVLAAQHMESFKAGKTPQEFQNVLVGHWGGGAFDRVGHMAGFTLESLQRFANNEAGLTYFANAEGYWADMFTASLELEQERLALAIEKILVGGATNKATLDSRIASVKAKVETDIADSLATAQELDRTLRTGPDGSFASGQQVAALIDSVGENTLYRAAHNEPAMCALLDQTLALVEDPSNGFDIVGPDSVGAMTAAKTKLVRLAYRYYDRDLMDAKGAKVPDAVRAARAHQILDAIRDSIQAVQTADSGNIDLVFAVDQRFGDIESALAVRLQPSWKWAETKNTGGFGPIPGLDSALNGRFTNIEVRNSDWGVDIKDTYEDIVYGEDDAPDKIKLEDVNNSIKRTKYLRDYMDSVVVELRKTAGARALFESKNGALLNVLIEVKKQVSIQEMEEALKTATIDTGRQLLIEAEANSFAKDILAINPRLGVDVIIGMLSEGMTSSTAIAANRAEWSRANKHAIDLIAERYQKADGSFSEGDLAKVEQEVLAYLKDMNWGQESIDPQKKRTPELFASYYVYKLSKNQAITYAQFKVDPLEDWKAFQSYQTLELLKDSDQMGPWADRFRSFAEARLGKDGPTASLIDKIEMEKVWFKNLHRLGVKPEDALTHKWLGTTTDATVGGFITKVLTDNQEQYPINNYADEVIDDINDLDSSEISRGKIKLAFGMDEVDTIDI